MNALHLFLYSRIKTVYMMPMIMHMTHMLYCQDLEEDGTRDQAGAQAELSRISAQQASNDTARRKLEQQLTAALEEASRLQTAHAIAQQDVRSQVIG